METKKFRYKPDETYNWSFRLNYKKAKQEVFTVLILSTVYYGDFWLIVQSEFILLLKDFRLICQWLRTESYFGLVRETK